jgi:exodeoxyribonuclease VII small subunit
LAPGEEATVTKNPEAVPGGEQTVAELAYEQIVEQLDSVVRQLEAGELSLEDSLRAFERGVQLAQAAERRLDSAEARVEMLLQGDRVQPLPAEPGPTRPSPRAPATLPDDDDVPF